MTWLLWGIEIDSCSKSQSYITLKTIVKPPLTPPYMFIALALTSNFLCLLALGNELIVSGDRKLAGFNILAMVVPSLFAYLAGTLPLNTYRPSVNVAKPNDVSRHFLEGVCRAQSFRSTQIPSSDFTCPEDNVNLWTWCTFSFMQPLLNLALKRTLHESDIWRLSPFFQHKNLFHKYQEYKSKYVIFSSGFSSSFIRIPIDICLVRFYGFFWPRTRSIFSLMSPSKCGPQQLVGFYIQALAHIFNLCSGFISPYALKRILASLANDGTSDTVTAISWTVIMFLANLSFGIVDLWQSWYTRRCYERTRGQLFCMLHYKSLKRQDINFKVRREEQESDADLGKILNLME